MDVYRVLESSVSQNSQERQAAISFLEDAAKNNFIGLVDSLVSVLSNASVTTYIRNTAGLYLKNILTSNVPSIRNYMITRWQATDPEFRNKTKQTLLNTLENENTRPSISGQAIVALAYSEFPLNGWPELIPKLESNISATNQNQIVRESSIECVGYICQDLPQAVLAPHSNELLNIIVRCMYKEESTRIRIVATKALYNALEFASRNFEIEEQRNTVMQFVCECSVSTDATLKVVALQCLCKIVSLYYNLMENYMTQALFSITFDAMKSKDDEVSLQGIEFWSSLSEEENNINLCALEDTKDMFVNKNYTIKALPYICPCLLERLATEFDDEDDDNWTSHKAAGVCLALMSSVAGNEIGNHVLPFVGTNYKHSNPIFRDASLLAFGSILDGPEGEFLSQIVQTGIPIIFELSRDSSIQVRDSSMWALGRVYEKVPHLAKNTDMTVKSLSVAFEGLKDEPRVAVNAAWTFCYLIKSIYENSLNPAGDRPRTLLLSQQYPNLFAAASITIKRQDGHKNGLRSATIEMLIKLIECHPTDVHHVLLQNFTSALEDFTSLFNSMNSVQKGSSIFSQMVQMQSMYCSVLQSYFKVLDQSELSQLAVPLMNNLLLNLKSTQIHTLQEDILLTLGALFIHLPAQISLDQAKNFMPQCITCLYNINEPTVCISAASVLSDISSCIGPHMVPFANDIMIAIVKILSAPILNDQLKVPLIGLMGDLALSIGSYFRDYLTTCLELLKQMSSINASADDDIDHIELVEDIRAATLEAYTGIIQGLYQNTPISRDDLVIWGPNIAYVLILIDTIIKDPNHSDSSIRSSCGLIGDILNIFKKHIKESLNTPAIKILIDEAKKSSESQTKSVAVWVQQLFKSV